MKRFFLLPVFLLPFCLSFFSFSKRPEKKETELIRAEYNLQCLAFEQSVDSLAKLSARFGQDTLFYNRLLEQYHRCRLQFKQIETLTAYFFPATAKVLNGPLVSESEEDDGIMKVIYPEGLQVIEDMLYSENPQEQSQELIRESRRTLNYAHRLTLMSAVTDFADWQIIDAMKQEVVRVFILSFAGYDTPASGRAVPESCAALENVAMLIGKYRNRTVSASASIGKIIRLIHEAENYLQKHAGFISTDRFYLIREYMNPLYALLEESKQQLGIEAPDLYQPVKLNAVSFWQTDAYATGFFSGYDNEIPVNDKIIGLGRTLFFDPLLSGNGQRSCASCHRPEKGFTDGNVKGVAFDHQGNVTRNTPTLMNVAFQSGYFYDSRALNLEDQIRIVMESPGEMHGNIKQTVQVLSESNAYRNLFREAFTGTPDTAISEHSLFRAIAGYERSLFSFNSRFDRHIRGEQKTLTKSEINGFNLFMGKALCGTCHFPPAFNGTLPPDFRKTEWEVLGTPLSPDKSIHQPDPDKGRGGVNGSSLNDFAFKTPTLRNIALTAPYMHNGVFSTLDEVMDFYNHGGSAGWGFEMQNQTLPFDSLSLSAKEMSDIIAFMQSLTDTAGCTGRPSSLPVFETHPEWNSRPVGGIY